MTPRVIAIAAMSEQRVIGNGNAIPWRLPEDMQRFARLTAGHAVLMGRKTFESLPARYKPLPGRVNLVATRRAEALADYAGKIQVVESIVDYLEALRGARAEFESDSLWIIGGEEIYRKTLTYWDEVYLTLVHGNYEGDAFFPQFEELFDQVSSEPQGVCEFRRYVRKGPLGD